MKFIKTGKDTICNLEKCHMITFDKRQIYFRYGFFDRREWISKTYHPEEYEKLMEWINGFEIGKVKEM